MGEGEYKHLEWAKSPGVTDRRRRPMRAPPPSVPDPAGHASALRVQLGAAVARSQVQAGYDARVLLKIDFSGRPPAELESIPGLEVVSEEPGKLILVFSTEEGRQEFARRLDLVARGSTTTRANLIFATQGIDAWTSDDRTTVQLAKLLPELVSAPNRTVRLDVELWPLGDERPDQADRMLRAFSRRAEAAGLTILDQVRRPMVLVRVEGSLEGVRWLLDYRDVREVTTPPNFYLSPDLRRMSLRKLKPVAPPPRDAPRIAVLDSGIVANHPLLGPAVADEESFVDGTAANDDVGHGTAASGRARMAARRAAADDPRRRLRRLRRALHRSGGHGGLRRKIHPARGRDQ